MRGRAGRAAAARWRVCRHPPVAVSCWVPSLGSAPLTLLLAPSAANLFAVLFFFFFFFMFSYTHNHARRSVMANVNYFHAHSHHTRKNARAQTLLPTSGLSRRLTNRSWTIGTLYSVVLSDARGEGRGREGERDARDMLIFITALRRSIGNFVRSIRSGLSK